jgi:hypothetical protein
LASPAPQIHFGCGAAVGSGGADIASQKLGSPFAAFVVVAGAFVVAACAGLVVDLGAGAHVAEVTQTRSSNITAVTGLQESLFLGIRS